LCQNHVCIQFNKYKSVNFATNAILNINRKLANHLLCFITYQGYQVSGRMTQRRWLVCLQNNWYFSLSKNSLICICNTMKIMLLQNYIFSFLKMFMLRLKMWTIGIKLNREFLSFTKFLNPNFATRIREITNVVAKLF